MSPGAPAERIGKLKYGELRVETGNLATPTHPPPPPPRQGPVSPFVFTPSYGGFAYLVCPRWVLGDNAGPPP